MVKTHLDGAIEALAAETDQRTLATWACDCVERVLPYFEERHPEDQRPRRAVEAARTWVRSGVFSMTEVRGASLAAHRAAGEVDEDDAARSAARAAGQALATAHVPRHAVAAAVYAATAVRDGVEAGDADAAVAGEREWQHRHLVELRARAGGHRPAASR